MMKLTEPWATIVATEKESLEAELRRELPDGHTLSGKAVSAIARRIDRDDVLYELDGGPELAIVHLTWAKETDTRWPATELIESFPAFERDRMQVDNEDYTSGNET